MLFVDPPAWAVALMNLGGWAATAIVEPFSSAMGQSMLLSVAAMAVGLVVAWFLRRSKATSSMPQRAAEPERPGV